MSTSVHFTLSFIILYFCFTPTFSTENISQIEPQLVISEEELLPMYPEFYLAMNHAINLSSYLKESNKATEVELKMYEELWNTYQNQDNEQSKLKALTRMNQLAKNILRREKNQFHITDFALRHPSVVEISGATFAHKQGIGGAVNVHVMERFDDNAPLPLDQHGFHVVTTLEQVAPHAKIKVGMDNLLASLIECKIVNISRGVTEFEAAKWVVKTLRKSGFLRTRLFVESAGNHGLNTSSKDPMFRTLSKSNALDSFVFVVNLDNGRNITEGSNTPGKSKKAQKRTICALGQNVLANISPFEYAYNTGTSMAAPILSGAAALVLEKFPHLSAKELANSLLHSADKEFLSLENGKHVYHYEKAPPTQKNKEVEYRKFDPSKYGMGILNLKNALLYAQLTSKKIYPHTQLRGEMKKLLEEEKESNAKIIQKWFRSIKNKHNN